MFYLLLFALTIATSEYLYFTQKLDSQRKQILVLLSQNNNMKTKINKSTINRSSIKINYVDPLYKNGYSTENSSLLLSPLESSAIIYTCIKAIKVNVLYAAEIDQQKWYEVSISVNNSILKGWLKDSDIILIVEDVHSKSI